MRVRPDNTAERVAVNIGPGRANHVQVDGTLLAGDRVIIRGAERLEPGQSVIYLCNTDGFTAPDGRRLSDLYCIVVLSQPADNLFGFGIATTGTPVDTYQLCIQEPDNMVGCDNFPFGPEEDGIKAGGVGCFPRQEGSHYAGWGLENNLLPIPLPFESSKAGFFENFSWASARMTSVSMPSRPASAPA